jgi:hypothetical protein
MIATFSIDVKNYTIQKLSDKTLNFGIIIKFIMVNRYVLFLSEQSTTEYLLYSPTE